MLEDQTMNQEIAHRQALTHDEAMVDARQASYSLRLPYYWFSDRAMRAAKRIPHYLLGGLVRFRMSELTAWAENSSAQQASRETE
jgi:tagatose-1,6-bisphosphate aldolase non-catalytic subunit AgaZ/GatZ